MNWQESLDPYLTEERKEKIQKIVQGRTRNVVVVLEKIYDQGNINAVLRSAESLGYQDVHIIENQYFKEANRVSKGAEKWLDIHRWQSSKDCLLSLKEQGFQILATHLGENTAEFGEMDFTQKTALLLGSEKDGVSQEALEHCDATVKLAMDGFTQSYNISVAAALCLYHIRLQRLQRQGFHGDLNETQKQELIADYYRRSAPKAVDRAIKKGIL